jgi:hypothetical protein
MKKPGRKTQAVSQALFFLSYQNFFLSLPSLRLTKLILKTESFREPLMSYSKT